MKGAILPHRVAPCARQAGETEAELMQRRLVESEARYRAHDAAIEAHRRAGTLQHRRTIYRPSDDEPGIQRRPRRGVWS